MTIQPVIVIEKLSKRYRGSQQLALDSLSLSVYPGEVYGFLGPNGAGKSTTIRLLMNFLQPTTGSARILGLDCVKDSVALKRSVGYLSGDFAVYPKMTGLEYLCYLDELQGGGNLKYAKSLAKSFKADLNKKLGELSRGNRQKVGLIQALMHKPKILILDEPTSGLDPLMQELFYAIIADAKSNGVAVFVSSHVLSEVQKMCDRVGIIRGGTLVTEQVMADLAKEAAQTFDITFATEAPVKVLKKIKGLQVQMHEANHVVIHMHGRLQLLFRVLADYDVVKIDSRTIDLEELFMHFYENKGPQK